jgi:hypothetical protein
VDDLSFIEQLLVVALGVATSVLIPVLASVIPRAGERGQVGGWLRLVWRYAKPYLALGLFSVLVGLVVLAVFEAQNKPLDEWWQAFLAGYASDSTLQKVKDGLSR